MREYNFKASDSTGEMLMGLGFAFSFMGSGWNNFNPKINFIPKNKIFKLCG